MAQINVGDPDDLPQVRETLRQAGIDPTGLTDDEIRATMTRLLDETVPAPAIPAGKPTRSPPPAFAHPTTLSNAPPSTTTVPPSTSPSSGR